MATERSERIEARVRLLAPVPAVAPELAKMTSRPVGLGNRTIGLLGIGKECAEYFLDRFEHRLLLEFEDARVRRFRKASWSRPFGPLGDVAAGADLVISAVAD